MKLLELSRRIMRFWLAAGLVGGCSAEGARKADPPSDESVRIIGGSEASEGAWPSVVTVSYAKSPVPPWWCGGTVIDKRWVLTAAHCVYKDPTPERYQIFVDRHDITSNAGHVVAVSKIHVHPAYSNAANDNDLALLELERDAGAPAASLVTPARMGQIQTGDPATVVGWGDLTATRSYSKTLQQVDVNVLGFGTACNGLSSYTDITNNEVCIGDLAGGRDSCQGDSGGPVFVKLGGSWAVLGVTSWGNGCALPDYPGIYALVPNYVDWVQSVTGANTASQ